MQALAVSLDDSDPELAQAIRSPKRSGAEDARARRVFWERVVYRPEPFEIPEELRSMVETSLSASTVLGRDNPTVLVRVDLDDDGESEFVLIADLNARTRRGYLFYRDGEVWRSRFLWSGHSGEQESATAVDILRDSIGTADPRFRDLTIGELIFRVGP